MQFFEILVRQSHPGPAVPHYSNFEQKRREAEAWKSEGSVPYPVLIDDVDGTVHQVYGGMSDPSYLIDSNGKVAFYCMWTHAPSLYEAIEALLNNRPVPHDGIDKGVHLAAAMTNGWPALRKGLPQSVIDLETSFPTSSAGPWLGYQMKALLAPLTLRAEPLPPHVKNSLRVAGVAVLAFAVFSLFRRPSRT